MHKTRVNMSGIGLIPLVVVIVVVAVVVLVAVDASRTAPATPQESCALVDHIILPDNCV
ncbi:MAG: hypothetical protein ABR514_02560 [Chthoniobacterales bacterium]